MNWYITVLKKYAVFGGRAQRKEYWYFTLFNLLIMIVLGIIDQMTGTVDAEMGMGILSGIYALAIIIPGIAVAVRRLHDTGRTGWWLLLLLIPLIGGLVILVFTIFDSDPEANEYGPNPKTT